MMWRVLVWEVQRHVCSTGGECAQAVDGVGVPRQQQGAAGVMQPCVLED